MSKILDGYGTSTVPAENLRLTNAQSPVCSIGKPDELVILFERMFSNEDLVSLNETLIHFIHKQIASKNMKTMRHFLSDPALDDFKPSFLKSILVVTNNVSEINDLRERVQSILNFKRKSY